MKHCIDCRKLKYRNDGIPVCDGVSMNCHDVYTSHDCDDFINKKEKMKKNCLTCRYEPEWVSYLEKERGQHGECKFPISKCECEAVFIGKETIYRDRLNGYSPAIQGKEFECGAWAEKEDK